jgi:hydrogenase maturation protease
MATALIVCIGNDLVADDGVGKAVYDSLKENHLPEGTRLSFLGLGGIDLLEEVDGEELLVVVDAVQLGATPGTVHVLGWDALPVMEPRPVSGHGIGVREAIEVGRRLYPERTPQRIYLVGVEGLVFDQLGQGLSVEIEAAVPKAVASVLHLLPN